MKLEKITEETAQVQKEIGSMSVPWARPEVIPGGRGK